MKRKKVVFLTMMVFLSFGFLASEVYANILIKVRALNPLESEEVASISYPLPKEVALNDILDKKITFSLPQEEGEERKDTFNIEYLEDEGRYFILDEVTLGPREVVTLEVHVNDIWVIPQERLEALKQSVEDLIAQYPPAFEQPSANNQEETTESVEGASDETITALQNEIFGQIDQITNRQLKSSVLNVGVEKHMEAYYENMEALTQVDADIEMLRYLLEPEEEEGEEGAEGEKESLGETELSDEEIPPSEPMDLISEGQALAPEG